MQPNPSVNRITALLAGTLLLLLGGCATKKKSFYLNTEANFGAVQRIAVLPLVNFTNDPHAPDKVEQILTIELLSARAFELADPGDVRLTLSRSGVESLSAMSVEQRKALGDALDAQALLRGTVREFSMDRSSGVSAPSVSLHFELVDTSTGETIWSSVVSRQGAGASAKLFGVGGASLNEALRDLVREALRTLIR
jgi:hypothetical protein